MIEHHADLRKFVLGKYCETERELLYCRLLLFLNWV